MFNKIFSLIKIIVIFILIDAFLSRISNYFNSLSLSLIYMTRRIIAITQTQLLKIFKKVVSEDGLTEQHILRIVF